MIIRKLLFILCLVIVGGCASPIREVPGMTDPLPAEQAVSSFWKNATVYFLLTDRFYNGDKSNDLSLGRQQNGAVLRSFQGGDLKGITLKIKEGYFDRLGVNAIWMTPVIEQIHGFTDEGTGKTYAYHGYWAKDWTALDPNFGTESEFAELIETAHQHDIRILMDVVINHTGPVTDTDPQWPDSWVRMEPVCGFRDYESTVACTLVENLPDIRTESDKAVELPAFLKEKWEKEGRLEEEMKSLDAFFERTGYPRAPRFYLIKWFSDWVRQYGIDGFRIDTAKHTEAGIWEELKKACRSAFWAWKRDNPDKVIDEEDFYMVGEVYNYSIDGGRDFDYGDQTVDFFDYGFESMINFAFKGDAEGSYEDLFSKYSAVLNQESMKSISVLNYLTSHDDGSPFDAQREKAFETGTKLLLSPGAVQIYYGDETARPLIIEGTQGDATLRSFMNWDDLDQQEEIRRLLTHWQKLGQFRKEHLAVGAGIHEQLQASPYVFKRTLEEGKLKDQVLIGLELNEGEKTLNTLDLFKNGTMVKDYYSGKMVKVESGRIVLDTPFDIVLLGESTK